MNAWQWGFALIGTGIVFYAIWYAGKLLDAYHEAKAFDAKRKYERPQRARIR